MNELMELYSECHRLFSYDAETGILSRKVKASQNTKAGDIVDTSHIKGYLRVSVNSKKYLLHRIIWLMVTGSMPSCDIDHVNCNKKDNRFTNLREATRSENMRNRGKTSANRTGLKGVTFSGRVKNPYRAGIVVNSKTIYLGVYKTPEMAHEAYCKAVDKYHGEFARSL